MPQTMVKKDSKVLHLELDATLDDPKALMEFIHLLSHVTGRDFASRLSYQGHANLEIMDFPSHRKTLEIQATIVKAKS